jgi:hypothetical protein
MVGALGRRTRRVLLWLGAATACVAPAAAQPRTAAEPEVKAAFVYQFGKYVDWPAGALDQARQLQVCVIGDDAFGATLDATLRDKTLHERPLAVRAAGAHDRFADCHILFVAAGARGELPTILATADARPILTIGEHGTRTGGGCMIDLMRDGARLRFAVNAAAARRAGLTISSQLLKLAISVVSESDAR